MNLYNKLSELFYEELHELELGHGFNKRRINLMFAILSAIGYLQFAEVTDKEMTSIISLYT